MTDQDSKALVVKAVSEMTVDVMADMVTTVKMEVGAGGQPTAVHLFKLVYAETHQAGALLSLAWGKAQFSREDGEEVKRHLTAAVSAMTTLDWLLRGGKMPPIAP